MLAELFCRRRRACGGRFEAGVRQLRDGENGFGFDDALAYAAAVLVLEPFYVAAGFGLYLNRRTLLEGWDIEVALRRIAERHAAALLLVRLSLAPSVRPFGPVQAQEKDPKKEIAEVLKAPEFGTTAT